MFDKGSLIVYGGEGVCRIDDIICQSFGGQQQEKQYYVLVPVRSASSKLYVPVDNEKLTSRIMTLLDFEEIKSLIDECEPFEWISDNKQRGKLYKEIFASYDRKAIFSLAKLLESAKSGEIECVKKLYVLDDDAIRRVSQILYAELSYSVELSPDEVLPIVAGKIELKKKN